MPATVRIKHPNVAGEAVVALSALAGYAARGWLLTGRASAGATSTAPAPVLTRPAANASADAWRTYAVAAHVLGLPGGLGFDEAMATTRDDLAARFAAIPDPTPGTAPAAPATTPQEN